MKKINPAIKWVAVGAFAVVGGIFAFSGGRKEGGGSVAQSEEFQRRNSDFDRFSAIRGEGNSTKPAPIADESAQKALGSLKEAAHSVPVAPADVKPAAAPMAEEKASKPGCESAWNADESCAKTARTPEAQKSAVPVSAPEPMPAAEKTRPRKNPNVHLTGTTGTEPVATAPAPAREARGGKRNLADYEQQLISMSSAKSDVVTGRAVKSNTDILKKGSRYLGIINEAMIVRTGEKHDVTIDVIARLSNNTTVKPFLLYGQAELNKSGTRVIVTVTDCIAADAAAEAISCKGVIQDHRGVTGLGGDTYNPNHYANVVRAVGALAGGGIMAMKTTSRTLNGGVLYDQTFGNGVLDAMAGSVAQAANDEAADIKSEGKRVETAPGAFVQVLIGEDIALW
ncbi:MAG: hypothetical protein M3Q07_06025 [Pseudobdellovibrionaceae bacterium]|nr:hypothetical protein [Pseudobdellovibrionaceae bacterium]